MQRSRRGCCLVRAQARIKLIVVALFFSATVPRNTKYLKIDCRQHARNNGRKNGNKRKPRAQLYVLFSGASLQTASLKKTEKLEKQRLGLFISLVKK